jgi:hypothetical protein
MPAKRKFNTNHPDPVICELEVIRQTVSYSQTQMAEALGVPLRTYQKWIYSVQKPRHATALLAKAREMVGPRRGNCWEIVKCGREPGGDKVDSRGPCPAAVDAMSSGVNGGQCGGRVCWAISGTFCDVHLEDNAARPISCFGCDFFSQVLQEEGLAQFKLLKPGQTYTQR